MTARFSYDTIAKEKEEEIEKLKEKRSLVASIESALAEGRTPVITETKKAGPKTGHISDMEPEDAAALMEEGGACAISVLTDKHFDGKICHLRRVKERVGLPVLRKDFIIDPFQLIEAKGNGANAVLLIASLLKEKTKDYVDKAHDIGLEVLLEIHDENDLRCALETKAKLIGINNRDLNTLETELGTTERLAPRIPKDRIIVSESGVRNRGDIERLKKSGAKAFLVGTSIMSGGDVKKKVNELTKQR